MNVRRASAAFALVLGLSLQSIACSSSPAPNGGSGGSTSSSVGGAGTGGSATTTSSTTSSGPGGGGAGGTGGGTPVPLPGFGSISGECGVLDAMEIQSDNAYLFRGTIDFGVDAYAYDKLSDGGKKIFDDGNLGGSSIESEIISYEVLHRCELADLIKTEGEVVYQDTMGKKTDLLVGIDGFKVGVSVTRAYAYPPDAPYTQQQAYDLLLKKLSDIKLSNVNVDPADAWEKHVLHVIAYTPVHADMLEAAYPTLDPAVRADTVLMITVTEGDDAFVY